ncbi:leucyl/phenylalanyl-tRNA--protein transferase [Kordiimonas pumila]|uniref:Leucyl/phenylalanyl-tRNA--protein transferase n=1 Tax=Kordiimonas pumila TaxID=2161677 RepID=A0ABV7D1Z4_9PROT|nr:leucyl/phenylalanyl-tRNA--protein transferase [Kordiimonas pumila]
MTHDTITPDLLLQAYASGVFPMSEGREDDELFWVDPEERGILPLTSFHIPKSLAKVIRQERYSITANTCFKTVVQSCAKPTRGRETTWISERIEALYSELHRRGYAHSIECWEAGNLVGGLYGVSLAGAFFGESMFSTATNASKVSLVYLVARLIRGGYKLLDTQFITDHLKQFGALEISRTEYRKRLHEALTVENVRFDQLDDTVSGATIMHLITQTS